MDMYECEKVLETYLGEINDKERPRERFGNDELNQIQELFEEAYSKPPRENSDKAKELFDKFFKAGGNLSRLKSFVIQKNIDNQESEENTNRLCAQIDRMNHSKDQSPERLYFDALKDLKVAEELYNSNKSEENKKFLQDAQRRAETLKKKVTNPVRLNEIAQNELACELNGLNLSEEEYNSTLFSSNASACEQAVRDAREIDPNVEVRSCNVESYSDSFEGAYEGLQRRKYNALQELYEDKVKGEDAANLIGNEDLQGKEAQEADQAVERGNEAAEKISIYRQKISEETFYGYSEADQENHKDEKSSSVWKRAFDRMRFAMKTIFKSNYSNKATATRVENQAIIEKVSQEDLHEYHAYKAQEAAKAKAETAQQFASEQAAKGSVHEENIENDPQGYNYQ